MRKKLRKKKEVTDHSWVLVWTIWETVIAWEAQGTFGG